jgi:predicted RNase H-like HicB family nuclease
MLTEYMSAAMATARYELLGGGEGFYGEIPGFQGLYANADTLEACREELASTLEDWLLFRISRHLPIPTLGGPGISFASRASKKQFFVTT